MLTRGFKNIQQERTDRILHAGLQLGFVPESWNLEKKKKIDQILADTAGLSLLDLSSLPKDKLLETLQNHNFSFENMEALSDLLMKIAAVESDLKEGLTEKALAVYNFVQKKNNTFSLAIDNKIKRIKEAHKCL